MIAVMPLLMGCSGLSRSIEDALGPLGLELTLETKEVDEELFKADPSLSNRIWIEDRPSILTSTCWPKLGETSRE